MSTNPRPDSTPAELRRAAARAPMLALEEERELLRRIQEDDDPRALDALLVSHLRMVLAMSHRYVGKGIGLEDLIAEGSLGLVEAARRFDRSRGTRFSTYAAWWVRALIRRYSLANRRIVGAPSTRNGRRLLSSLRDTQRKLAAQLGQQPTREQVAEHLGVTAKDVEMVDCALGGRDVSLGPDREGHVVELTSEYPNPEQQASAREVKRQHIDSVERALDQLDHREREIVEKRILSEDRESLVHIGERMGLSRERVRQLELRARQKLRDVLLSEVA